MSSIARLRPAPVPQPRRLPPEIVPASRILGQLGITAVDLEAETVTVNTAALRSLLAEFARQQPFDPDFYSETYPDIEAARLAGLVSDLHMHFAQSGFLEGRLPAEPAFDPVWYAQHYPDLAAQIAADDAAALRNHFITAGLAEGRVGTAACLRRVSQA